MSAMHWEARRRQNVLDRRMATKAKQSPTGHEQKQSIKDKNQSDTSITTSVSNEPLVIDQSILCHCQMAKKEQYSAKIEHRYTSVQYSQQW